VTKLTVVLSNFEDAPETKPATTGKCGAISESFKNI